MSKDDWWVDSLSDKATRDLAKRSRVDFDVDRAQWVDIIRCVQSPSILTVKGRKNLKFEVKADKELGDDDGITSLNLATNTVIINVKQSIFEQAKFGVGRARMTHAHELAHAVLHPGVAKSRKSSQNGLSNYSVPAHQSAEHQAKVFASAFLADERLAIDMQSVSEISEVFGISYQAAEILYSKVEYDRERIKNVTLIRQLADQCIADLNRPKSLTKSYLHENCTTCGARTVTSDGSRYQCDTCRRSGDKFQDGDRVG